MRKSNFILSVGVLAVALMRPDAARASMAPADRPDQIERAVMTAESRLRPSGEGTFRAFGFKIYQARLWLHPPFDQAALLARPFALDLRYARDFKGRDIARSSRGEMDKLGAGSAEQRTQWEAQLASLFPDVKKDDHLTGIWRPGRGTLFLHNGQTLAEVPGDAFARAFFGIWLDPKTSAPALREALLQESGPP